MKITYDTLRDYTLRIALDESEYLRIPYDGRGKEARAGLTLEVQSLRVSVDLVSGESQILAGGYLLNKDGKAGERERDQFLTPEQIPEKALEIIHVETRAKRDAVHAGGPVTF